MPEVSIEVDKAHHESTRQAPTGLSVGAERARHLGVSIAYVIVLSRLLRDDGRLRQASGVVLLVSAGADATSCAAPSGAPATLIK